MSYKPPHVDRIASYSHFFVMIKGCIVQWGWWIRRGFPWTWCDPRSRGPLLQTVLEAIHLSSPLYSPFCLSLLHLPVLSFPVCIPLDGSNNRDRCFAWFGMVWLYSSRNDSLHTWFWSTVRGDKAESPTWLFFIEIILHTLDGRPYCLTGHDPRVIAQSPLFGNNWIWKALSLLKSVYYLLSIWGNLLTAKDKLQGDSHKVNRCKRWWTGEDGYFRVLHYMSLQIRAQQFQSDVTLVT